jgi:hypothetical protein
VEQFATDDHGYFTSDHPVDDRADYRVSWVEPAVLLEAKPRVRTSAVLRLDGRGGRYRTSTGRGT